MTYRLAKLGKRSSQLSQQRSTAYELRNRTPSRWSFLNRLSCNTSDLSLNPNGFRLEFRTDSTPGIVEHLTNLYRNSTQRLWATWGGLEGPKMRSNVVKKFRTLLYVGNCARQSYLFLNRNHGGCCNTVHWHQKKWALCMKLLKW